MGELLHHGVTCPRTADWEPAPLRSPPEELVMPRSFPRAPVAFLSAVLSPLAWQFGRPDLFDTYSFGILLMQLCGVAQHVLCSHVWQSTAGDISYCGVSAHAQMTR